MKTSKLILASVLCAFISASAEDSTKPTEPDNTRQNQIDRGDSSITPVDQSNDPEDVKVTQAIRKEVMKQEDLSSDAKNVKIVTTSDRGIFLRGVVESAAEKTRIGAIAKSNSGGRTVSNQLSVKQ